MREAWIIDAVRSPRGRGKPGVGSRFMVSLDRGQPQDIGLIYELENQPKFEQIEQKIKEKKPESKKLKGKVLLVEDNEDNQRIIGTLIQIVIFLHQFMMI